MPTIVLARDKRTGATYRVSAASLGHPVLGKHLEPADKPAKKPAPKPAAKKKRPPRKRGATKPATRQASPTETPVAGERKE